MGKDYVPNIERLSWALLTGYEENHSLPFIAIEYRG